MHQFATKTYNVMMKTKIKRSETIYCIEETVRD